MKFKLDARLILFFCCLCLVGVSSKKSSKDRCLRSLHSMKHQLLECHGKYVCNKSIESKCKCIGKDLLCNGKPDCPGGEDEKNCTKKAPVCTTKQVLCPGSIKCATPCNNHSECEHGQDEQGCVPTCRAKEMICPDGKCATICDNKQDCKDGLDETECKNKECGALPDVQYGHIRLLDPNSFEGSFALLKCDEGYIVEGIPYIKCQETNGTYSWTTNNATCVLRSCGTFFPTAANGEYVIVRGSGQVGDIASLVCKEGFCLYPENLNFKEIICNKSGQWSTPGDGECKSTKNLALGADTSGSTATGATDQRSSDQAVDGNRLTEVTNTPNEPTCFRSIRVDAGDPFLEIKMNEVQWIKRIVITNRNNNVGSLQDIVVTVGIDMVDQACGVFLGPADATRSQYTINCATVIMGNTVRITRTTTGNNRIILCEVEVYSFMSRCNGLM